MDIKKSQNEPKANKVQTSNLGKSEVVATSSAKGPRAKSTQTETTQPKPNRTATTQDSTVRKYVEEFKSLMDKSLELLQTIAETRALLIETLRREKTQLTRDQQAVSAALDKKITTCSKRMKLLHGWLETAAKTQQPDKLEKICQATNIFVVDALDNSTKEYTSLMLRIFSEDEDLEAQLAELTDLDQTESSEESSIEEAELPDLDQTKSSEESSIEEGFEIIDYPETKQIENVPETKPWSVYGAIQTLIYGTKQEKK